MCNAHEISVAKSDGVERNHVGDFAVDGKLILKWILRKQNAVTGTDGQLIN